MSMKQILFNTEMVRAILDGRKSCTRRIVKPQQLVGLLPDKCKNGVPEEFLKEKKLMFKPEKFYRDGKEIEMKWHPSLHMPKDAARIFLRVTNVRVERLQEITTNQIEQEGVETEYPHVLNGEEKKYAFQNLWNSTIKKSDLDRYGWDANPYVWVIEFERCDKPGSEV